MHWGAAHSRTGALGAAAAALPGWAQHGVPLPTQPGLPNPPDPNPTEQTPSLAVGRVCSCCTAGPEHPSLLGHFLSASLLSKVSFAQS